LSRAARGVGAGGWATFVVLLAGCAAKNLASVSDIPPSLKVTGNQAMSVALHGAGVQIYECRASKEAPNRFAWTLRSPEADLSDHAGKLVGRHYAGPTWEANDGSEVVGEVVVQESAPAENAVPWLLLRATSNTGKKGLFAKTASIQRVHTVGGKAPATGCDAKQAGKRVRVAYAADYYFYRRR
jgi:hypothetical protein